jgi:hypothetical protein
LTSTFKGNALDTGAPDFDHIFAELANIALAGRVRLVHAQQAAAASVPTVTAAVVATEAARVKAGAIDRERISRTPIHRDESKNRMSSFKAHEHEISSG